MFAITYADGEIILTQITTNQDFIDKLCKRINRFFVKVTYGYENRLLEIRIPIVKHSREEIGNILFSILEYEAYR